MNRPRSVKSPQGLSPDSMARRAVAFSGIAELEAEATPRQPETDLLNTETLLHETDVYYRGRLPLAATIDLTFIDD